MCLVSADNTARVLLDELTANATERAAPAETLSFEVLNHASVNITGGSVSLVSDPWYSGFCFRGGWGLRYANPDAMARAAEASHLWISHLHGDHLHIPTLKELAKRAPGITVLANRGANFDVRTILEPFGFKSFVALDERKEIALSDDFRVMRYPTSGIDNMLLMRVGGRTILNYNDCNIPVGAAQSLRKKIGPIDVLMLSYNHAFKWFEDEEAEAIKAQAKQRFLRIVDAFQPRQVIPFASAHYYRAKDALWQNESLLDTNDLKEVSPQVLPVNVGMQAVFAKAGVQLSVRTPVVRSLVDTKRDPMDTDWDSLMTAAHGYRDRLSSAFLGVTFWIPPLRIWVEDLERMLVFDVRRGISEQSEREGEVITASASSLAAWFRGPYGTDTFAVGADFAVTGTDATPLHRHLLAGVLLDNRLSGRDLVRLMSSPAGWRFLANRREELWAILRSGMLRAGWR